MRMKRIILILMFSFLFINCLRKQIDSAKFNYLIEHSQSKIEYNDTIYLFNGWYYPEIWKINLDKGEYELLTKDWAYSLNSEDPIYYGGAFEFLNNYEKVDDIYVFHQNYSSSIAVFSPQNDYFTFITEYIGIFLGKSYKKNIFYIFKDVNTNNPVEKIIFNPEKKQLIWITIGYFVEDEKEIILKKPINNKYKMLVDDINTGKQSYVIIDSSLQINDADKLDLISLDNIEKEYIEEKIKKWKNYNTNQNDHKKRCKTLQQINHFGKLIIEKSKYFIVASYPLTIYKEVLEEEDDYYIYENIEHPIIPYKMEYDKANGIIIIYGKENFENDVELIFTIETETFERRE